jgi:hypothetical protein
MVAVLEPSVVSGKTLTMNFNLLFMDLVNKDEGNETEVLSDMQLVGLDVLYQLQHPDYAWTLQTDNITIEDFTERLDDEVSGVLLKISLKIPSPYDRCAIPQSPISITNQACAVATIYDQDGNVVTTVQSGGSYTVTLISAISGGNASTTFTNTLVAI